MSFWSYTGLGISYALAGRVDDALAVLEQADEIARRHGRRTYAPVWGAWVSEAHLLGGRQEVASQHALRALDLSVQLQERSHQVYALRILGEIAAHYEPPKFEEAQRYFHEALALAEDLGMRPLQAHCHLGLGKLYRRVGRLDEARAKLLTAATMLREMGMSYWLPEAEAELAQASSAPVD